MKTEITRFCEACAQALEPLPATLKSAADHLEGGSDPELLRTPLATVNELRARLRSLTEKLGNQQAYLLIFGPLKSGKSTLMNAISGAYVSEVTSLPGYPCLVYVQHAEQPHFSVTRYNGRESVFANGIVLKDVIADSHVALADQIRATEQAGYGFDPRHNFPEAIRRVDVKVPVQSLAESSTVLVDTPGLYSRMNFGYDVLTREFRNSAACAVFVVKTDNLFLEQVFAEFNQLLDLFSRIFLVINVDSSKRDLLPDGSLQPSAESQEPAKIIEAFKTLSMAGPLRQAYENDRLRLHAVDLLSAASAILAPKGNNGTNGASGANGSSGPGVAQREAFDNFLRDLTDYLNSSDYTLEFIRDSLRQGMNLCDESREIATGPEIGKVGEEQEVITDQIRVLDEKIAAAERLLRVDWTATFDKVREENSQRCEGSTRARAAQLSKDLRGALDRWYEGSASLKALSETHWTPLAVSTAGELAQETRSRLRNLLDAPLGGTEPAAAVITDLLAIDFKLGPIGQTVLSNLDGGDAAEPYQIALAADAVPVRKSFGDWILFRSQQKVQRRLFGEDLAQEIAPEVKQKRLPETSHGALEMAIDAAVAERFPSRPTAYSEHMMERYIGQFRAALMDALQREREQLTKDRAARQAPFDANEKLLTALKDLNTQTTKVAQNLIDLARKEKVLPPAEEAPFAPAAEPTPTAPAAPTAFEPEQSTAFPNATLAEPALS